MGSCCRVEKERVCCESLMSMCQPPGSTHDVCFAKLKYHIKTTLKNFLEFRFLSIEK
jgi:hypothetical protein